jgi:3-methyladenine DNA glycosylase AlkD
VLDQIDVVRRELEARADPVDAAAMRAYMKDQFAFFGVATPERRAALGPTMAVARRASGDELCAFADVCWQQPEREFQYVGTDALRATIPRLEARHLVDVERLIVTKSWWDTVDLLAGWCVGGLVRAHPELVTDMDRWIDADDMWLARSAILHQLRWKEATDVDRLFDYALRRAGDTEFFIRKAIGWALRQHARTDPDAVRRFVTTHEFSALTTREALKHLEQAAVEPKSAHG